MVRSAQGGLFLFPAGVPETERHLPAILRALVLRTTRPFHLLAIVQIPQFDVEGLRALPQKSNEMLAVARHMHSCPTVKLVQHLAADRRVA
jgi:hypothetical protein